MPMWESLGTRMSKAWPGTLWVSRLLYGSGSRYSPARAEGTFIVHLRPGSLEEHLAATPADALTQVAAFPPGSVVDDPVPFGTETSEGAGKVRGSVDAIVFLHAASAPVPRKK